MGLSLHVGRLDWWNVLEEMTPHQLNTWVAYSRLEPFGEDRADIREAVNANAIMRALGAKQDVTESLARYLKVHRDDEVADASPAKAAAMLRSAFGR